jgi:hypothetical protein
MACDMETILIIASFGWLVAGGAVLLNYNEEATASSEAH